MATPARVVLEPVGGQSPQKKLVTESGTTIVAGNADVVMIMGSEAGSTAKYFAGRDDKPDYTETVDGQLEDRGHQIFSYVDEYTVQHGLTGAPVQYGLLDNARRSRLGLSVREYRHQMAELFAPMSKVAAKNPLLVIAGGTLGLRDRDRHRREPDDLRPVPPGFSSPATPSTREPRPW